MKKLIFTFTVLLFISCESEDSADDSNNSSNSDNSVLVKTITITTNDGDYSSVINEEYFYEDNKIERRVQYRQDSYNSLDDVYKTFYYTYANNKIINVKEYDASSKLQNEHLFDYDNNGNIISYTEKSEYANDSKTVLYEGNKVLTCDDDDNDSSNIYGDNFRFTTNSNGDLNFGETVENCSFSSQVSTGEYYYSVTVEFDSNPSPFKNIEGNNFLISGVSYLYLFTYAELLGYHNNVKKITYDDTDIEEWTYDYNSDNYPRNVQWLYEDEEVSESINIEYY